ncbi:phytanoyl-CoA dioxygenase family protein [Thalassobacillus pellis]|uniref:phytanoyl-CoA dioxygenase family protein n=1 Tax=Thalassobacillus pellis TaxID=748008 RepID=UPI0019618205|nr:phytanoyl-CoA dioxygenase family protein [Thalassobacillus pellis]MBM7551507.1 ectoine hydroxylase-related dioxygenase (phytanoyl-CoA dioxygenase family) [Thalassobacillus pellis]
MISEKDVAFYQENGYLLVKNVFNHEEVTRMQKGVDGIIQRATEAELDRNHAWQGDYLPKRELKKLVLKGFHDIHYQDASFTAALSHPNMNAILTELIGPNVQLHHSKMLVKPPENGAAFPMHQDYPYFPHKNHTMLAASVHLDDADLENGCLHVVPGSHHQGPIPHRGQHYLDAKEYPIDQGKACPAKAGDVLFFNYLTIHGSKPNTSDRTRRNVLFQLRDPEDPPVNNEHVNWGQGLMVCGQNPTYREYNIQKMLQQA